MIKHERNFELNRWMFVVHVNLSLANRQATSSRISIGDIDWNPYLDLIDVLQRYTIAAQDQSIFAWAWRTM